MSKQLVTTSASAISEKSLEVKKKPGRLKTLGIMGLDVAGTIYDLSLFFGVPITFLYGVLTIPTIWYPIPTPFAVKLFFASLVGLILSSIVLPSGYIKYKGTGVSRTEAILDSVVFKKLVAWYKDAEQRANKE